MEITVTLKPVHDSNSQVNLVVRFTDADLSVGPGHLAVVGRMHGAYGDIYERRQYGWPLAEIRGWIIMAEAPEKKPPGQVPDLPSPRVGDPDYHSRGQGTLPDR